MARVFGCILKSPRNAVLLVRGRTTGKWSFPKGHAYDDESPLSCARRETFEETGIVPSLFFQRCIHLAKGTYFLCNVSLESQAIPKDLKEVDAVKWVSIDDIPKFPCNVDVNNYYRLLINEDSRNTQRDATYTYTRCLPPIPSIKMY